MLFRSSKAHPAIVRLSAGIGLPQYVPDILGMALRLPDCYGYGRHQDFLMLTAGTLPILRHIFYFTRFFWRRPYCSILAYHAARRRVLFAVFPPQTTTQLPRTKIDDLAHQLRQGKLRLSFMAASPLGPWQEVAVLEIHTIANQQLSESLKFNPWNSGPDLVPFGFLNRLRRDAYQASQAGRSK